MPSSPLYAAFCSIADRASLASFNKRLALSSGVLSLYTSVSASDAVYFFVKESTIELALEYVASLSFATASKLVLALSYAVLMISSNSAVYVSVSAL